MSSQLPRFYTSTEVAQMMRVNQSTISIKTSKGLFPGAFKIGYEWRYPQKAIDAYIKNHTATPEPAPASLVETAVPKNLRFEPRSARARAYRQRTQQRSK